MEKILQKERNVTMKKILAVLLMFIMVFHLSFPAYAIDDANKETYAQTNYIASQETLDELYQEHLSTRSNIANLSLKQRDYIIALGYSEDNIANITNGEVADLLKTGSIVKPSFIEPYIDMNYLTVRATESKEIVTSLLEERGLTESEREIFFEKKLVPWNYSETDNTSLYLALERQTIEPRSSSCHIFAGSTAMSLLSEDNVHFHSSSYPRYIYDGSTRVNLPLKPVEGTYEYDLKMTLLSGDVNMADSMASQLYGTPSGVVSNYYLWCEESSSTSNKFHEGVDTYKSPGTNVYSLIDGTVIQKTIGSSTSLSKLLVYNSTYDVTVQYLHGNWSNAPSSGSISQGYLIGTEDKRGANGYHTHVQIMDGRATNVPQEDGTIGTLRPYNFFSIWC